VALQNNPKAKLTWETVITPGRKKMFLFSLNNLKTEAARQRKVDAAVELLLEGKKFLLGPDAKK
jgi:uncharacterized protein YdeI (YjbR/CyaY-like superfamily)